MNKPNNIVRIPTSIDGKFFRYWMEFLTPFHKLTDREMDIMSCFLKHRYYLSKSISDPEILDKVVMGEDTRRKIREECKVTLPHFQVIMGKLRKSKVIIDNRINPKFIPNLVEGEPFQLMLYFDLK